LKFTVTVFGTIGAIEVVMAHKKLKGGISKPFNFWRVQMYCHTISDRLGAGCNRCISAFDLHEAEATGGKRGGGFSDGA